MNRWISLSGLSVALPVGRVAHWALALIMTVCLSQGRALGQDSLAQGGAKGTTEATAGTGASASPEVLAKGKAVFNANCKQCHAFNEVVVGPALKDSHKRWPNDKELRTFIKYPQRVIESGNAYARGLYEKYKQYMPNHDFLSDADIDATIAYIKQESEAPAAQASVAPTGGGAAAGGGAAVAAAGDGSVPAYVNLIFGVLLVVLVIVLLVLVLMISMLAKALQGNQQVTADDREFLDQKSNWTGFFTSMPFRAGVIAIGVLFGGKAIYDRLYSTGIQQGYAPAQPIAFSHKLHAGQYEIDCGYCHTTVYKAKSASIPAVNVCLNCHNAIKTQSPQIRKLWAAVERNQPIEWVRVHNLPDLAYFNHAQHTKVGGVACQTCHGAIQEMEVVKQHSTLTMGWCINCHRQTAVNSQGNAYYDKLVYLHNQAGKGGQMRVADIGGLECSKCHY